MKTVHPEVKDWNLDMRTESMSDDDEHEHENFDYAFHAQPETKHDAGEAGVSVRHMLIGQAILGICSGPLAAKFANDPERLGAFAASVVDGADRFQFEPDKN